jgi:predicted nucleotidyltransferase
MICPPQTNTRMTILSRQYNLTFKQLLKKIYYTNYYQEHKEKVIEYNKAYREANKEKIAKITKAYYEANKEKMREYNKAYQKAHREKHNVYCKTYREANSEMILEKVKVYREKLREEKPKYNCPCGACILDWGYTVKNHEKTKKHQKWLSSQK